MTPAMLIVLMFVSGIMGQNQPSADTIALANLLPILNTVNGYVFDGPPEISHAPTTPAVSRNATQEQIAYYNNYAAAVYCPYELDGLTCFYCQGFKKDVDLYSVLTNDDHDTLALVTISNSRKEIVVTYRGTMELWNVILDLAFYAASFPGVADGIELHTGFYIAAMSLYNQTVENVPCKLYSDYKIVFVGHSLGAAMARITYYFFKALNQCPNSKYELYTFGEPRSGNQAWADYMNKQDYTTARTVNKNDLITHIPPTSVLTTEIAGAFYIHAQTEMWDDGVSKRFCNQSVYEDPNCSDSRGPAYTLLDHVQYLGANYLTCIAEQPLAALAIPASILQPVGTIPPLPSYISNITGGLSNFVSNILNFG